MTKGFDERIKSTMSAPAKAPFATDPHAESAPSRRASTRDDLFSARVVIQLSKRQHEALKSFRRVGVSYSAIVRACITKLESDPGLLAEVQEIASDEAAALDVM